MWRQLKNEVEIVPGIEAGITASDEAAEAANSRKLRKVAVASSLALGVAGLGLYLAFVARDKDASGGYTSEAGNTLIDCRYVTDGFAALDGTDQSILENGTATYDGSDPYEALRVSYGHERALMAAACTAYFLDNGATPSDTVFEVIRQVEEVQDEDGRRVLEISMRLEKTDFDSDEIGPVPFLKPFTTTVG